MPIRLLYNVTNTGLSTMFRCFLFCWHCYYRIFCFEKQRPWL